MCCVFVCYISGWISYMFPLILLERQETHWHHAHTVICKLVLQTLRWLRKPVLLSPTTLAACAAPDPLILSGSGKARVQSAARPQGDTGSVINVSEYSEINTCKRQRHAGLALNHQGQLRGKVFHFSIFFHWHVHMLKLTITESWKYNSTPPDSFSNCCGRKTTLEMNLLCVRQLNSKQKWGANSVYFQHYEQSCSQTNSHVIHVSIEILTTAV